MSRLEYAIYPCAALHSQGARTDINAACQGLKSGKSLRAVAEETPEVFVKYDRGLRAFKAVLSEPEPPPPFRLEKPYVWQSNVLNMLSKTPDDRHIVWIRDSEGGKGKSVLAKHIVYQLNGVLLEGSVADMAYMYNCEPIAMFDVTRSQAELSDHLYTFAEKLKNGLVVSKKYESRLKKFRPPHVVFFCNFLPKAGKWSKDRVYLIDLDVMEDACKVEGVEPPAPPPPQPPSRPDSEMIDLTQEDETVPLPNDPFVMGFC